VRPRRDFEERDKEVEESLRRFAEELRERGAQMVVLFGSRAQGTNLMESDADLLIVWNGFQGMDFQERWRKIVGVYLKHFTVPIEPICLTMEELEKGVREGRLLIGEILLKGRPLIGEQLFQDYKQRIGDASQERAL